MAAAWCLWYQITMNCSVCGQWKNISVRVTLWLVLDHGGNSGTKDGFDTDTVFVGIFFLFPVFSAVFFFLCGFVSVPSCIAVGARHVLAIKATPSSFCCQWRSPTSTFCPSTRRWVPLARSKFNSSLSLLNSCSYLNCPLKKHQNKNAERSKHDLASLDI